MIYEYFKFFTESLNEHIRLTLTNLKGLLARIEVLETFGLTTSKAFLSRIEVLEECGLIAANTVFRLDKTDKQLEARVISLEEKVARLEESSRVIATNSCLILR